VIQYVRADQHEEVTEHPIAGPIHCKVRQTIEKIVCTWFILFNNVLDRGNQGLKSLPKREIYDFQSREFPEQWFMLGKAKVDQAPALSSSVSTV